MGAAKMKADKMATDHNVDDIGEKVIFCLVLQQNLFSPRKLTRDLSWLMDTCTEPCGSYEL
jgi:hypothetical protein